MNVVVVGSGIAGLTAALHAHEAGHRVTLVTKGALGDGSTSLAQGGIAGVYGPDDSPVAHAEDTTVAGAGLSDPAAVAVLVRDAAARIAELIARGVEFDRTPEGALMLGREAAHSAARIVHAGGDATGAEIVRALVAQVRAAAHLQGDSTLVGRHAADPADTRSSSRRSSTRMTVREAAFLVDIVIENGAARGIRVLAGGGEQILPADAVILATGGAGQLYAHTTNPAGATGDGIAAALRAGAAVADLEFVQFHPTVLTGAPFLVSEAVRGEGATLIDDEGRRFCLDEHPDGELAPRDVVARAIARRAAAQGSPVRLDARMLGAGRLAERFPTIDRELRRRGLDWAREPIPVTPAAHYLMGGIATDLDGRTSIPCLFAVGETARTGVHGANRLASNSLLEGAVFAARAAAALDRPSPGDVSFSGDVSSLTDVPSLTDVRVVAGPQPRHPHLPGHHSDPPGHHSEDVREDAGPRPPHPQQPGHAGGGDFSRAALQQLMWDAVGLLRRPDRLRAALDTLRGWRVDASGTVAAREDANLLLLAEATATCALARTESVGAHHVEAPIQERV